MEINTLRNFLAVAREQNMTAAAKTLHISQSVLSRQMSELEQELHTQLFIRTNRSTLLTREGNQLQERAMQILNLVEKTENEFLQRQDISGEVRILHDGSGSLQEAAEAVRRVREQYPQITFRFHYASYDEIFSLLDSGTYDFALLRSPADTGRYQIHTIGREDRAVLLLHRSRIPKGCTSVRIEDLYSMMLMVPESYVVPSYPKKLPLHRGSLHVMGTYHVLSDAVPLLLDAQGAALCFASDAMPFVHRDLAILPLAADVRFSVSLLCRRRSVLSEQAQVFRKEITT